MGLFSGTKITTVGTSVQRVIEDRFIPEPVKTGGVIAIQTGADLFSTVSDRVYSGLAFKVRRFYQYGKNHYTHGLPSGKFVDDGSGTQEIINTLAGIHGTSTGQIQILYDFIYPTNFYHLGWAQLINDYGYVPETNELTVLSIAKGKPVYLDDMVMLYPSGTLETYSPESFVQWGTPANAGFSPSRQHLHNNLLNFRFYTPPEATAQSGGIEFRVKYSWGTEELTEFVRFTQQNQAFYTHDSEELIMPLASHNEAATLIHVKYRYALKIRYFTYDTSLGTYPNLDSIVTPLPTEAGQYFPFSYFRYENTPETDNPTSESYKTGKKLLTYLNLDYDDLAANVNAGEGIEFVEQAMLTMAIPANDPSPIAHRYLFEFFQQFPEIEPPDTFGDSGSRGEQISIQLNDRGFQIPPPKAYQRSFIIQDKRFKLVLDAVRVRKRRRAGIVGAVGSYSMEMSSAIINLGRTNALNPAIKPRPVETHVYRYQVDKYFYEEVELAALEMRYHVYGEYTTTSFDNDGIRLIPLDFAITDQYNLSEREELYARSQHFIFNSKQETRLPWWRSGFFGFIVIVVVVVLMVVASIASAETLSPIFAELFGLLVAAGTASGVAAIIVGGLIVALLALGFALSLALNELVNLIGLEETFIAALILIAASYYYPETSVIGGETLLMSNTEILLHIGLNLIESIGSVINERLLDIQDEYLELIAKEEEVNKEFDQISEYLENDNHVLAPLIVFGEEPQEFFNRTIHHGNIGVLSVVAVHSYFDTALTLPELQNT